MRRLIISHVTEYEFSTAVTLQPHQLLLRPRESHTLRIESSTLEIHPAHRIRWHRDALDNSVASVSFLAPSNSLRIASNVRVEMYEDAPFDFLVADYAVTYPFEYALQEQPDLAAYRQSVYVDDRSAVNQWLVSLGCVREPMETFVLLDRLNRDIANRFVYQAREEPGVQSPAQTLSLQRGSCRDFAALFMEACRHLGLASRFVSGYLDISATSIGNAAPGNASTHAWAEVYLPGPGWKGFDPTSGVLTDNRHIPVAVSRHPEAIPPVAGSFVGPAGQRPVPMVSVQVSAVDR
ncbi:MAG: cysteine protease [Hydrogenophilales bacterium 28-61-23]|nr:MAG: cysteine protease [Hydrogenophilales bacterium 28-61-23]